MDKAKRYEIWDVPQVEYITGADGIREPNRIIFVGVKVEVFNPDDEDEPEPPKKSHQSPVDWLLGAGFDALERGVGRLVRAFVK